MLVANLLPEHGMQPLQVEVAEVSQFLGSHSSQASCTKVYTNTAPQADRL